MPGTRGSDIDRYLCFPYYFSGFIQLLKLISGIKRTKKDISYVGTYKFIKKTYEFI